MHQKDAARRAWQEAGLYRSSNPQVRDFLRRFENSSAACWEELADVVRLEYPDLKETLVRPLWDSGDKVLRVNLLRLADLRQDDEAELYGEATGTLRGDKDAPELETVIRGGEKQFLDQVGRKRTLPEGVRRLLEFQRESQAAAADPP